jgi:hypothetical protein
LGLLLDAHPELLTLDEIVRETTGPSNEFGPRDRIDNAVRDLVASELADRHGSLVFASRAAVGSHELRT